MDILKVINMDILRYKLDVIVEELETERLKFIDLLPLELQKEFADEAYIAGGSIYTMYHHNNYKDVDLFIHTLELKNKLLTYFKSLDGLRVKFYDASTMYIGKYNGLDLIITDNAISIGLYQIILKDYGTPEQVVGQFDFKHNMFYIHKGELGRLVPLSCLESEELEYNTDRARDIVGTLMRVPKFVSRGMVIRHKEMAKILLKLHQEGFNEAELAILNSRTTSQSFGSGH